jgi:2-oxoisovalerate dehydrogenase E2 component (dihydrolipoyl transacylase)
MERVFNLPDLGEGLTEGEVLRWLVAEGDEVALNQPLVEVETAKAAVEVPSPVAGTVVRLHAGQGQAVDVGAPLATFETAAPAGSAPAPTQADGTPEAERAGERSDAVHGRPPEAAEATDGPGPHGTLVGPGPRSEGRRRRLAVAGSQSGNGAAQAAEPVERPVERPRATPPVRKYARDHGVDLQLLTGTGKDGRITRSDVEAALAEAEPAPAPVRAARAGERAERRIPVKGVRKAIAAQMVASVAEIPHVTEFLTVDATALLALKDRLRALPEAAEVRITPLAVMARALAVAARLHPLLNASWHEDASGAEIVTRDWVHLGVATDTEHGLVVPVVRDADQLGILDLAREIGRLTGLARSRKASPADLTGSTITITNVGGFGVETGTPIINRPECAIVATGLIAQRPWVVDGELTVRSLMTLSVSFDHRIVDGAEAARFLTRLRDLLEDPALMGAF